MPGKDNRRSGAKNNDQLPERIMALVFRHVDVQALKECRRIDPSWKNVAEAEMRKRKVPEYEIHRTAEEDRIRDNVMFSRLCAAKNLTIRFRFHHYDS